MEQLIKFLNDLEADETIKEADFMDIGHHLVEEISALAEALLITPYGKCDWERIKELSEQGFHVFPIEKDGFGWLIGGIQTSKGVVTYG